MSLSEVECIVIAIVGAALRDICCTYCNFPQDRREDFNSDFATFILTIVILLVLGGFLLVGREWQSLGSVFRRLYVFLRLSGLATGASWVCYYRALKIGDAARVAPIDKLSLVVVAVRGAYSR